MTLHLNGAPTMHSAPRCADPITAATMGNVFALSPVQVPAMTSATASIVAAGAIFVRAALAGHSMSWCAGPKHHWRVRITGIVAAAPGARASANWATKAISHAGNASPATRCATFFAAGVTAIAAAAWGCPLAA